MVLLFLLAHELSSSLRVEKNLIISYTHLALHFSSFLNHTNYYYHYHYYLNQSLTIIFAMPILAFKLKQAFLIGVEIASINGFE